ncbi:long-chain-fatty-acid--CoA ligase [Alcanivorax balearicus MACL04]|uniref:Long-chain-fatty-acid--CoA ligase n=1 Tax=Alloalcanivorax balearicus MACL04 TaxID=1177182 RepID=A0ABT2R1V6_9GAMM|nr:acyl-CoA synthetase [Alloalcanivorax balearicus]MCU5783743.1 long-chain-fatty-acid--CoA ligase [Alloalcanivorax balearicus MACL04]
MNTEASLRHPGLHARVKPDHPAVILADTGRSMSYAELDAFANRLARVLQNEGLDYGEHIACLLENRLECPAVQWGGHYAGLYYTFVSTRLKPEEVLYILEDCEARVVILSAQTATPELVEAIGELPLAPKIFMLDEPLPGCESLEQAMAGQSPEALPGAREGSDMLYSSGTTGRPKGVKPEISGLPVGSTETLAGLIELAFGGNGDMVYLSPAPYYHAAPLKWTRGVLVLGGTAVIMEKFDPQRALENIQKYKVTHSQWVPTMFHRMLHLPEEVRNRYDVSSLKMAVHAAAPCPVTTKQAMIDWWGPVIYEYYGSTEGAGLTMTNSEDWKKHTGTVGKAIYGTLHIVDEETGEELPIGQEGAIYFSGGHPFEYHKDPSKTAEAHNDEGWACVGDIGWLDEDGYLYLTDRKSNMIISGGVNIYPQEVENTLMGHRAVFDVAVIGIPNEEMGESVHAIVQSREDRPGTAELATELLSFCREKLSSIKCPRTLEFRDTLPREPNGKLLKRLLRDEYREGRRKAEGFFSL